MTISKMIWIPGYANLADPGAKTDSSLTQRLQILLIDRIITFYYKHAIMQSSDCFTGCTGS